MHKYQHTLAIALTSIFVLVQTAAPWLHVGCQHDHSHAHAAQEQQAAEDHSHCGHHHCHSHSPASDSQAEHGHEAEADSCAACRLLVLSVLAPEVAAQAASEPLSLLEAPRNELLPRAARVGCYRSRAPPLS